MIWTSAAFLKAESDWELVCAELAYEKSPRGWIIRVSLASSSVIAHYTWLEVSKGCLWAAERLQSYPAGRHMETKPFCFLQHIGGTIIKNDRANLHQGPASSFPQVLGWPPPCTFLRLPFCFTVQLAQPCFIHLLFVLWHSLQRPDCLNEKLDVYFKGQLYVWSVNVNSLIQTCSFSKKEQNAKLLFNVTC